MISVILMTHNNRDQFFENLERLKRLRSPHETIAVASACTDGTNERLLSVKGVKSIITDRDIGPPECFNLGAKIAKGDFLFIADDHTYYPTDMLPRLQKLARRLKNWAVVSPGEITNPVVVTTVHPKFGWRGLGISVYQCKPVSEVTENECSINGLIKRHVFEELGGFDSNFFLTWGDLDFSQRVKRLGYKTYMTSNIWVVHPPNHRSANNITFFNIQGSLLFLKKHYPQLYPIGLLAVTVAAMTKARTGNIGTIMVRLRAMIAVFRNESPESYLGFVRKYCSATKQS